MPYSVTTTPYPHMVTSSSKKTKMVTPNLRVKKSRTQTKRLCHGACSPWERETRQRGGEEGGKSRQVWTEAEEKSGGKWGRRKGGVTGNNSEILIGSETFDTGAVGMAVGTYQVIYG